eukprot:1988730-Pyramimonas_sp.AAC.1
MMMLVSVSVNLMCIPYCARKGGAGTPRVVTTRIAPGSYWRGANEIIARPKPRCDRTQCRHMHCTSRQRTLLMSLKFMGDMGLAVGGLVPAVKCPVYNPY